jgi:hypothetical protein
VPGARGDRAKPPQPIDKGLPDPGLLAHVITSKYSEHLPLYRQEDVLARHGVTLSRATLCGWMAQAAELLRPLYEAMVKRVRATRVIWTDDTTVPVWVPTLPATRAGRFWVYLGDARNPFSVYEFTPRRSRDGPERFLDGYRGYLQADAFAGYYRIYPGPGGSAWRAGPMSAASSTTAGRRRRCRPTRRWPESGSSTGSRRSAGRCRLTSAVPGGNGPRCRSWRRSGRGWMSKPVMSCPGARSAGRSPVPRHKGEDSRTYTRDGEQSIDNNCSERRLRAQAVGRKNFLFVGSDRGGRTVATLYSFVASCKRLGGDPFACHLREVLERLPTQPADRLSDLLPDAWIAAHPGARRKVAS